jgi:Tfp pilus assembly protein FimV
VVTTTPAPASAVSASAPGAAIAVPLRHLERLVAGRRHTVRPGETLWAIARAMLPDGAPDADVMALVRRLWSVNAERIGTGSPDVLPVGVVLRLPALDRSTPGGSR